MEMNRDSLGRIAMSVAIFVYAFIPPLADLATDTHVFHPDWPAHARLHTVWLLGITTTIGVVALYLLWRRKPDRSFNTNIAGVLSVCVYGSFFLSTSTTSLYEGALTDQIGGIEQAILGIDLNLFTFSLSTGALLIGWGLCSLKNT